MRQIVESLVASLAFVALTIRLLVVPATFDHVLALAVHTLDSRGPSQLSYCFMVTLIAYQILNSQFHGDTLYLFVCLFDTWPFLRFKTPEYRKSQLEKFGVTDY